MGKHQFAFAVSLVEGDEKSDYSCPVERIRASPRSIIRNPQGSDVFWNLVDF